MGKIDNIRTQLQAIFVFKAPATLIGWIWKAALVLCIQWLVTPKWKIPDTRRGIREKDSSESYESRGQNGPKPVVILLSYFIIWACLVVACQLILFFIKRRMQQAAIASNLDSSEDNKHRVSRKEVTDFGKKLWVQGLDLIPAWAYKDVVGSFITWTKTVDGFPSSNVLSASIVLAFSTCLAISIPEATDDAPFWMSLLAIVSRSLGLGTAYAFEQIVEDAAGDYWSEVWFQLAYVPLLFAAMVFVRPLMLRMSEDFETVVFSKFFEFLASSCGFIVAWSWNQLLECIGDAIWETDDDWMEVFRQIVYANFVSCAAALVVTGLSASPPDHPTLQSLSAITVLSAGINVGWFWANVASAVYDAWGGGVLLCWLLVAVITLIVPPISFCIDMQLRPSAPPKDITQEKNTTPKNSLGSATASNDNQDTCNIAPIGRIEQLSLSKYRDVDPDKE